MRRALPSAVNFLLLLVINLGGVAPADAQQPTLHLPFPGRYQSYVNQAAHGSFSHGVNNTRYDIDLNTENDPKDEVVLASAQGTAYVIPDAHPGEKSGFGNHVNIDHGPVDPNNPNGERYFSVYCHLKTFLISNGQFVSQGQPVGMEGCSGYCFGDHVHFGLHVGNPRINVGSSRSVRAEHVISRDVTNHRNNPDGAGPFIMLNTEQFRKDHYYESNNAYPSFCTNATTWNFTQDSQCWAFGLVSGATTMGFNAPGAWIIKVGKDPHVESPPLSIDAASVRTVAVHMASLAADTTVQVFFKTDGGVVA